MIIKSKILFTTTFSFTDIGKFLCDIEKKIPCNVLKKKLPSELIHHLQRWVSISNWVLNKNYNVEK